MPIRLSTLEEFEGVMRMSDIPDAPLTPDEVDALSKKEFDYADKERVSLREAKRRIAEQTNEENIRRNLADVNKYFGTKFDISQPNTQSIGNTVEQELYDIYGIGNPSPGELTGLETAFEISKAGARGTVGLLKIPGVLSKAVGELAPTRMEVEQKLQSDSASQYLHGKYLTSPLGKKHRQTIDMLRRAGNAYIEKVGKLELEESAESKMIREGEFLSNPVYRTSMAVSESFPSFGAAVIGTMTTGNPWVGATIMGTTTSSQAYEKYRDMGVDPDLALIGSLVEGSIEVVTEKVPMDELMKGGARPLLLRAMRLGTFESFQELFAQLGQNYTEAVTKDVDPENYATVLKAAKQEWSVISNGWQDAMAAGFVMGGGAAMFSGSPPNYGRDTVQLMDEYAVLPRNEQDFLTQLKKIRQDVKQVEQEIKNAEEETKEAPQAETVQEQPVEPPQPSETVEEKIKTFAEWKKDRPDAGGGLAEDGYAYYLEQKLGRTPTVEEVKRIGEISYLTSEGVKIPTPLEPTYRELQQQAKDLGYEGKLNVKKEVLQEFVNEQKGEPVKPKGLKNLTDTENAELADLEKQLSDKLRNQLSIGLDPETFLLATRIGSFYVKAGYRGFKAWAAQVRSRIGDISTYTLRTIYANLRNEYDGLDTDEAIDAVVMESVREVGTGELETRTLPQSTLQLAVEKKLVEQASELFSSLPQYHVMNMAEQAARALRLIEADIERAKRVAYHKESPPEGLFAENVYTALALYAAEHADADLIMELALNEDAARMATVLGQRIKALDTGEVFSDPIRAIRDVVAARKERKVRKGEDVSKLEQQLRELQTQLERRQNELNTYIKQSERRSRRTYGTQNKLVTREKYDAIIERRRQEAAQLRKGKRMGAVYIPTKQDFQDLADIGMFHLEAMGRDFAKWSYYVAKDLGEWVAPHLEKQYQDLLDKAEKAGQSIPESKRLRTKKKRLATQTAGIEQRLSTLDIERTPRFPIELDAEGEELQKQYDIAREKLKAAQATANLITEKEVQIISRLAKEVQDKRTAMENSERRKEGKPATEKEMEYGMAVALFLDYVNDLRAQANKRTVRETIRDYLNDPKKFLSDIFGTLKAAKASLDNSFHGRQGLNTLMKGLTGDVASLKIWTDTFINSWKYMYKTLKHKQVMHALFAEMVSDPDFNLLKQSGVAIDVIEEEIPVDVVSRIPLLGILFRMGENAFVASSRYMRYQVAKQYIRVARKSGLELNKVNLQGIGRLANSQTGRGEVKGGKEPGVINNVFWSPRNIRADVDLLTLHLFSKDFGSVLPWQWSWHRRQAALNLLRRISGTAMILALADWIDDDSVTWDITNADFGKIKIGNTRFSVAGSIGPIVVLAGRIARQEYTSSTTLETKPFNTRLAGKEFIFNYLENKASPATQLAFTLADWKQLQTGEMTIPSVANQTLTPLMIQNILESGDVENSANIIAIMIAEALGVNVQSYAPKEPKASKKKTDYSEW